MNRLRFATVHRPRRPKLPIIQALGQRGTINALAVAFGVALLAFLSFGQGLLQGIFLIVLLLLAGAGTDQVLRAHPRAEFEGPAATAIYLFVPVLYTVGVALFLDAVSHGLWNLPAAVLGAAGFGLAAHAEYLTVEAAPETYPIARFALSLVSYLTAFALFTVVFTSDLPLPAATLIVAVVSLLLTVDILRELEVQTLTLFAYAAAIAAVVAEVRWAIYYLALGDLLAGGLLLITFYLLTGLVQSYLSGHFDRHTMIEYGLVGIAGLVIITVGRILSRSA